MTLVVDCCIREDLSRTRKLYLDYLSKNKEEYEVLYLTKLDIKPLTKLDLDKRDSLVYSNKLNDKMFDLANQFNSASNIIIAAPFYELHENMQMAKYNQDLIHYL